MKRSVFLVCLCGLMCVGSAYGQEPPHLERAPREHRQSRDPAVARKSVQATYSYSRVGLGPLGLPRQQWHFSAPGYNGTVKRGLIWEFRDEHRASADYLSRRRQLVLFGIPLLPIEQVRRSEHYDLTVEPSRD